MQRFEGVVVPDDAARLWPVLVDHDGLVCEVAELREVLLHVEDVGVRVHALEVVVVVGDQVLKQLLHRVNHITMSMLS